MNTGPDLFWKLVPASGGKVAKSGLLLFCVNPVIGIRFFLIIDLVDQTDSVLEFN